MILAYILVSIPCMLATIQADERIWNSTRCDEQCKCDVMNQEIPHINSFKRLRTADCNGRELKRFSVSIPKDVQVIKAEDNELKSFNEFISEVYKLPNLNMIEISENTFTNFKANFACQNVTSLEASDNKISVLSDDVLKVFPNLKSLTMRKNEIRNVDNSLCHADKAKLERLILSYNKINDLAWLKKCASLRQLNYLDISENKLTNGVMVDDLFQKLGNLRTLLLEGLQIHTIERKAFSGLYLLKELDLDNNQLTFIPSDALINTPNIKILSLNGNLITRIEPNTFSSMKKLQSIELSNLLRLEVIDYQSFNNLSSLETLLLFNNPKLTYIDGKTFTKCPKLVTLDVHNSMLETILEETTDSLPSLKNFNFNNNPINCNSLMSWAKKWSKNEKGE